MKLLSFKYFDNFEWSEIYKETLNPFRKGEWSKRTTIKDYKQKTIIPYFNKNLQRVSELKSKNGFDQLDYNQLKLLTAFLCEFMGYDMGYFDTNLDAEEISDILTIIIEILDKKEHDKILQYIVDEIGMYLTEFDYEEI